MAAPFTINSLVLVEATFNCVTLAKQMLQYAQPDAGPVQFVIGFKNLMKDGQPPKILDGKADRERLSYPRVQGPKGDCFFSVVAPSDQSSERVAFRLVSEVYHFFNLVDDVIPYSAILDRNRVVDPSQI